MMSKITHNDLFQDMTVGSSCPSFWSTRCDQGEERHNTMKFNTKIIFKYSINRICVGLFAV